MGFLDGSGVARLWEHIVYKLGNKVDKEIGKGLSTNDYTTTEKNKLAGIAEGANKTIVDSALSSTSTNPVQNKVVNAAINDLNTLVGDTPVSSQITTAIAGKADLKHTHSLSDIEETYSAVQRVSIVPEQTSESEISSIQGKNLNTYVGYKASLEIDNKRYQGIIEKTTIEGAQAVLTSSTSSITYTIESSTFTDDTINFSPSIPSGITLSLTVYKDVAVIPENSIDSNIARVNDVRTLVKQKVDKEAGKGLSTNDFTTAEKNKLAGIAENANNYTLPVASSTLGGVKTTSTVTSTTGLTASPIINGVIYYKNTTYTLSSLGAVPTYRKINGHNLATDIELTATDVGAVSPEDLQAEGYITGISGADVLDALGYTPVNQADLGDFAGASATQAGDVGLVPAPSAGDQSKFLRGDGTWATVSTSGGDYLPLTGGTLTGNLTVNGAISVNTANRAATAENLVSGGYIADANTALSVGTYSTNDQTTNLPFQTYGTLFTYKPDQNWIVQIWTSTNSTETCLYMRKNTNGDGFGSWFKVFGNDMVLTIAQGGTGANNASDALINLGGTTKTGAYQFQQLPSGTDLSSLTEVSEGLYWYEGVATIEKGFPYAEESPRLLIEIKGSYWNASAGNGYRVIIIYDFGKDKIWIRRNWWGGWSEWKSIYDTHNIIYSSTQPSNASTGTIWLKPV